MVDRNTNANVYGTGDIVAMGDETQTTQQHDATHVLACSGEQNQNQNRIVFYINQNVV
jgi:hypothetical protein